MNTQPPSMHDLESFLSDEDSGVAAIYRKLPRAEPDAALDAAVLAMARRAVTSARPVHAPRARWMPALAAAAVIALAAGVALRIGPRIWQRPTAVPAAEPMPSAAQREESSAPTARAKPVMPTAQPAPPVLAPSVAPMVAAPAADIARKPSQEMKKVENAASPPMPQAFPTPAPERDAAAPSAIPQTAAGAMRPQIRLAAPAAAFAKDAALQQALRDIRRLLREQRRADALRALADFRKRYPDYPLPADLRDMR
jgi:Meckel syndrome type 1 protein